MPKKPLYQKIVDHFKQKISLGEFKPEDQLPTEMEIVEQFQVSRITATRALNELEQDHFIYRVRGSGSFVKKREEYGKISSNEQGGMQVISLVLPSNHNFTSDYLQGIENVAKRHKYFVTFHTYTFNPARERRIIEEILNSGSRGIILYPERTSKNMALYTKLMISKYPLVLIDNAISGLNLPLICTNNKEDFCKLTKHLIDIGHRRIIFAGSQLYSIYSRVQRYEGFCKAHLEGGVQLMDKHLFTFDNINDFVNDLIDDFPKKIKDNFNENKLINALFDYLENLDPAKRPTAIAALSDHTAAIIMNVARERGISIPDRYSIISLATGDLDGAIAAFSEAVRENPDGETLEQLGMAYLNAGRDDESLDALKRALELNPDLEAAGRIVSNAEGAEDLAMPTPATAVSSPGQPAVGHRAVGDEHMRAERYDSAVGTYQMALQQGENDEDLHCNLGWAHERLGQDPQAMQVYQDALKIYPDAAEIQRRLANVMLRQGQQADALAWLEYAAFKAPDMVHVRYDLALVYHQMGRPNDAWAQHQALQNLDPATAQRLHQILSGGG